jgi:hypothetical protein
MRRAEVVVALLILASCKREKPPSYDRVLVERTGTCARTIPEHETVCWGDKYGPAPKVGGPAIEGEGAKKATGDRHMCERYPNNTVNCTGDDSKGQLGGSTHLIGVVDISAAGDGTCAVLSDGDIRCWGDNDHGQLGPRAPRGVLNVPTILILPKAER